MGKNIGISFQGTG